MELFFGENMADLGAVGRKRYRDADMLANVAPPGTVALPAFDGRVRVAEENGSVLAGVRMWPRASSNPSDPLTYNCDLQRIDIAHSFWPWVQGMPLFSMPINDRTKPIIDDLSKKGWTIDDTVSTDLKLTVPMVNYMLSLLHPRANRVPPPAAPAAPAMQPQAPVRAGQGMLVDMPIQQQAPQQNEAGLPAGLAANRLVEALNIVGIVGSTSGHSMSVINGNPARVHDHWTPHIATVIGSIAGSGSVPNVLDTVGFGVVKKDGRARLEPMFSRRGATSRFYSFDSWYGDDTHDGAEGMAPKRGDDFNSLKVRPFVGKVFVLGMVLNKDEVVGLTSFTGAEYQCESKYANPTKITCIRPDIADEITPENVRYAHVHAQNTKENLLIFVDPREIYSTRG
jgi:hypothetical protein